MKKLTSFLLALVLTLSFIIVAPTAEAASVRLSGASSLRAGNTFTLTFSVSGKNISSVFAYLNYDTSKLECLGASKVIGIDGWAMEATTANGGKFSVYDNSLNSPINSAELCSFKFRVKSNVSAGSTVSVSISSIVVTNESSTPGSFVDSDAGSAKWSAKILAPLSSNAKLDSLTCSNGTLSPSFSSGTTSYKMTVPYSVKSLDLDWDTAHSGASASVSGNKLSVGSNTVTIKVTAEDGSTKRYTIAVTREQDPNYVPSTDAALASLKPSASRLSPKFSPDITDYVVYVAHEIETVELEATARDSKALGVKRSGSSSLVEGENLLSVTCTAEDGKTAVTYTVHVIRMPLYEGVLPEIIPPVTEPVVEPEPEPEPDPTTYDISLPLMLTLPYIGEVTLQQAALGALIALGVILLLLLLIAWAIGRRGGRKKAMKKMAKAKAAEEAALAAAAATENTPAEESAQDEPAEEASAPGEAAAPASGENVPAEDAVEAEVEAEEDATPDEPAEDTSTEEAPVEEALIGDAATAETPVENTPAEEAAAIIGSAAVAEVEAETEQAEECSAAEEEVVPEESETSAEEETPAEELAEAESEEAAPVDIHPENADASEAAAEDAAPKEDAAPEKPAEDPAPAQPELSADEQPASRRGSLDALGGMTLDELLEDIRNM